VWVRNRERVVVCWSAPQEVVSIFRLGHDGVMKVGVTDLETLATLKALTLCRVGDEVVFDVGVDVSSETTSV
jgi:hypothetical protein